MKVFNDLSPAIQRVVAESVSIACDYVTDMVFDKDDPDFDYLNRKTTLNELFDNAVIFAAQQMDPEGGDVKYVSPAMIAAIREVVMNQCRFTMIPINEA